MENERIIEIFLGVILIAILGLGIILVMMNSNQITTSSGAKGTPTYNYYNEYTTNNYQNPPTTLTSQGRVVYDSSPYRRIIYREDYKNREYWNDNWDGWNDNEDEKWEELDYSYFGKTVKREGVFGNDVYEFQVYVKNKDSVGGYFRVVYSFEDCSGREFKESITKYIRAGEREKLVYTEVVGFEKEICDWDYKVVPDTKRVED